MPEVKPATVLAGAALVVVAVSLALSVGRLRSASATPPKRFSGSSVVLKMPSLFRQARMPTPLRVAIVRDDAAARYYDAAASLDSIVRRWSELLTLAGARPQVVRPGALAGTRADVIVVPSSPCLTIETRAAIDAAGSRGQGLIVSGPTALNDAGCRNIGWGFVVALTGASRVEQLVDRPMVYVTLPAGSPLTTDIPPGARVNVSPARQTALRVESRDAFYSDYTLGPSPAGDAAYFDGAITRSSYRGARAVYLGFELKDAVRSDWNGEILRLLVRNAVMWTANQPIATVENWPRGHRAAAIFAQDVEDAFATSEHAFDSLQAAGVPGTYFVTSDIAQDHSRLTRRISTGGEVGTHSENHELLGGQEYETQVERLMKTRRDLDDLVRMPAYGLRPPEEQFDEATMAAWLAAGGTYMLGANDARCAAPELLPVRGDTLVMIPRVFGDDFAIIGNDRSRSPKSAESLFRRDYEKARDLGGLYVLSYHSQVMSRPEYVPVLARIAREAAADSTVWVTTAGEAASWWRTRARLDVNVRRASDSRYEIRVRNRGELAAENAVVSLSLPGSVRPARSHRLHLPAGDDRVRLAIPRIPGSSWITIPVAVERR